METTPETLVKRIDLIVQELQELRRALLLQARPRDGNLAKKLYGALGQGSWDEYDLHLDWQRFAS